MFETIMETVSVDNYRCKEDPIRNVTNVSQLDITATTKSKDEACS